MSEVLDPPVTDPVTAALGELSSVLDGLADADLWMLGNAQVLAATAELDRLRNRVEAVEHRLVREVDARGAAVQAGASSVAAWLRHRLRLHPGAAKRLAETAKSLHDPADGALVPDGDAAPDGRALLREAFAAGEISAEHAGVACQILDALPAELGAEMNARAETYLVEQAAQHDPKGLAHLGRHLRHVLDPDGADKLADDEDHQRAIRSLQVRQRNDGSADVRGHLDPELTAALLAQLTPLAAPRPATGGLADVRTLPQRTADALAELLRRYAGAELGPTRHGAAATVTITMALETLERRLGSPGATLDWSGPVSAETARRLACDARVIPVVLGSNGEPLDVGRASYPVTTAIWRALVARDGGCSFAGCDRPPEWTEAHHRVHWEDGGETSVANCCLLCDVHHRVVHHHGWDVVLLDGVIHVIPPRWVDPDQRPRRNTGRADLAALANLTPSLET